MKLSRLSDRQLRRLVRNAEVRFSTQDYDQYVRNVIQAIPECSKALGKFYLAIVDIRNLARKEGYKELANKMEEQIQKIQNFSLALIKNTVIQSVIKTVK